MFLISIYVNIEMNTKPKCWKKCISRKKETI